MPRSTRFLHGFPTRRHARLATLAGLALLLQACGGGGGGGSTAAAPTYPVAGTVSGLPSGASLVLLDNSGDAATVSANGAFTFSTPLAAGAAYAVTVGTRPSHAHCTVSNGSGTVGQAAPTGIAVSCSANPVNLLAYNASLTAATVSAFTLDPSTGGLTPVAGSPYAIGASTAYAVDPAGRFVYSGTPLASHSIVTFPIDPTTGAVGTTPTTAVVLPSQQAAQSIVFNAAGTMAYVGIVDTTSGFAYSVASFSVNPATGALTAVGGTPPSTNASPRITLDAVHNFALVTSDVISPVIASAVSVFPLDPTTHALLPQTAAYPSSGTPTDSINTVAVLPNGNVAYLLDATTANIVSFGIDIASGVLTPTLDTPYHLPPQPVKMVFNASGARAVAVGYNNFMVQFDVAPIGTLTAVSAPVFPLPVGANVQDLAMDPTGSFVYTANSGTGSISGYAVDVGNSGGHMSDTPGSPYTAGSNTSNVAVLAARP